MTKQDKILKSKLGLLNLVQELGNVSRACELMGYSRDSYYRLKELYDKGGILALQEKSRKKPNLKNRVNETVEASIINMAYQKPFYGQLKAAEELKKQGVSVSAAGVRSVWRRYDLENFKKRIKALGTKILQEGYHPNEWQIKALEQAQRDFKPSNSFETYFPGHLIVQNVSEVVTHQTLGVLYQYVLMDLYSRLVFVQVCNNNSTKCAIESIKKKMLPFFTREGLQIHRLIATKEECFFAQEEHDYQNLLDNHGIESSFVSKKNALFKPIINFTQTINNNFYSEIFRSKTYTSIAAIQADLDHWVTDYNNNQPIYERYNYGKTPMVTFKAILPFTNYLKQGKSKEFPNGLHKYLHLLEPLVIPEKL